MISAVLCRRFPLTSTSVWSGLRPRRPPVAITVEVPPPARAGRLNEGTRVCSAWKAPARPVRSSSAALSTSIGVGLSVTVRGWPRTPVTTTSETSLVLAASAA